VKSGLSHAELDELADALELEMCVERLLALLFPGEPDRLERPGRYTALENAISSSTALREVLLKGDDTKANQEWRRVLEQGGRDIDLHHTLAVLYREHALTQRADGETAGTYLDIATALWVLLLVDTRFWDRFDAAPEMADTRTALVRELIDLQVTRGSQALAAGRPEAARRRMRCLDACRSGREDLVGLLTEYQIPYRHSAEQRRLQEISALASEAMDGWCSEVIESAERLTRDPELISKLPTNLPMDYGSGIARLAPFVGLGVSFPRALSLGLRWHNDWCSRLEADTDRGRLKKVLESARTFAEGLEPLCTKDDSKRIENQALSKYYSHLARSADDTGAKVRDCKIALEWNPSNSSATIILVESYIELAQTADKNSDFAKALKYARKAQELKPDIVGVDDFVAAMERMARDEPATRAIREAVEQLKVDSFDAALQTLQGVTPEAPEVADEVRFVRMQAYLGRGITTANNVIATANNYAYGSIMRATATLLDDPIHDLETALSMATEAKDRNHISEQLTAIRDARHRLRNM
jgi:tetratricopeptide (TPR) repeat protein